ncbi:hypothetical protein DNTS_032815 [Danionella cerebrum]|uniref:Uncharacterized protein n=1 Tax=Danionella cerebrum TaxID=2873325 RepID=A0A553RM42_9TELE|nr:hypothetical protein DNTS_032815 [Danionella translucida]
MKVDTITANSFSHGNSPSSHQAYT